MQIHGVLGLSLIHIFLTTYSIGGKVNEAIYSSTMNPFYYGQTFHKHLTRAWKQPGDITDVPRVEVGTSSISSDRFLVDASYFSIKNITIGYTIPEKAANYIGMKSVRVYCSMDNLALFTHLKGMNPTYTPVSYTHLDVYKRQSVRYLDRMAFGTAKSLTYTSEPVLRRVVPIQSCPCV